LSVTVSKLGLFGFGLTLHLAAVCGAAETPKILVTSFHDVRSVSAPQLPNFEARFAAQFETVAEGRAKAPLDANGHPDATPLEANEIRSLARNADAAFVLVGEWRPAEASSERARGLDVALELRSGHSGATEHRYRLAWDASSEGAERAEMQRVARAMLQDLQLSPESARVAPVAASGDVLSPTQENGNHARGKRTDFLTVKRDQPIAINSEELELLTEGDAKRLIFSDEVLAVQGEMRLFAGHLEAFYPKGASQPERLKASHNVRMVEGDLEVHCLEATYLRDEGLVICRGNALLVQGCDEVRGREIVFHLDQERVKINGAASVVLHLDQDDDAPACGSGDEG